MSYLIFCSFEVGGFPFRIAETLKRYGVETYYIYLGRRGSDHDSAEFHYGNQWPDWDLSNSFQNILGDSPKVIQRLNQIKVEKQISNCLATGKKAFFLRKAGIKFKYWSYGADIDQECFVRVPISNHLLSQRLIIHPYRVFSERWQARKSIRQAASVMISPYQFEKLRNISTDKKLFFLPHFFKTVDYQALLQEKAQSKKIICEQIGAERYFFSSTRHIWSGPQKDMADNKGNQVILNSFAGYRKIANDHATKLVLVRKGSDFTASISFSKRLDIENQIVWVDEMKREDLNRYYQGAAICFGQFGTPVVTYSALEPLANGTISISLSNVNHPSIPFYNEVPPLFDSKDPNEIAPFIARVLSRKEEYADLSYKSWLWVQNNCSEERFVKSFIELFQEENPSELDEKINQ